MKKYVKIVLAILLIACMLFAASCQPSEQVSECDINGHSYDENGVCTVCGDDNGSGTIDPGGDPSGENQFKDPAELQSAFKYGWITISFDDTMLTIAENSKALYFETNGSAMLYTKDDNTLYTIEEGVKSKLMSYGSSAESPISGSFSNMFSDYLGSYYTYIDATKQLTGGTVAGRACDKYIYTVLGVGTHTFYLDKETQYMMKDEIVFTNSEGVKETYVWEVTEFKLGEVDLSKFINMPTESGTGFDVVSETTFPSDTMQKNLGKYGIPELKGGNSYEGMIGETMASLTIKTISESAYISYLESVVNAGFEQIEEGYYSKTFSGGESVSLTLYFYEGEVTFIVSVD